MKLLPVTLFATLAGVAAAISMSTPAVAQPAPAPGTVRPPATATPATPPPAAPATPPTATVPTAAPSSAPAPGPTTNAGGEVLTLDRAIEIAMQQQPSLRQSKAQLEAAQGRVDQAHVARRPTIGVNATAGIG